MKSEGLIAIEGPGHMMSEDYLKTVLEKYKSGFGIAAREDNEPGIYTLSENRQPTLDELKTVQEVFKDSFVGYYFVNSDKPLSADTLSPFTLLSNKVGDKEVATLVGFLEGDFSDFHIEGQPESRLDEFFAAEELRKELKAIWEASGSDFDKLWATLSTPMIGRSLVGLCTGRGAIRLMGINGKCLMWDKDNDLKRKFGWGYTSNHLGHEEKAAAPPDTGHKETPLEKLARLKAEKAGKPPVTVVRTSDKPPGEVVPGDAEGEPVKPAGGDDDHVVEPEKKVGPNEPHPDLKLIKVPQYLPKDMKKHWFFLVMGRTPKGFKDLEQIHAMPDKIAIGREWLKQVNRDEEGKVISKLAEVLQTRPFSTDAATAALNITKDVTNHNIAPEGLAGDVIKFMAGVLKEGLDPKRAGIPEGNSKTWTERHSVKFEDTFRISKQKALELISKVSPAEFIDLAFEWRAHTVEAQTYVAEEEEAKRLKTA